VLFLFAICDEFRLHSLKNKWLVHIVIRRQAISGLLVSRGS